LSVILIKLKHPISIGMIKGLNLSIIYVLLVANYVVRQLIIFEKKKKN